ncbi:MAG TPA: hypothetical protein ENN22_14475 [bacterium]|nr:hypothetical protein [bacterium]
MSIVNNNAVAEKERFYCLLMGAIDDELSAEQATEFHEIVSKNSECRREWQNYQKLKEVTKTMKLKSPPAEVWDSYWKNVYNRIERGIGWIVFSIGAVILITYGLFKAVESVITDTQLELVLKIGIIAVIAGLVILLVSVAREKLLLRKTDPYKEVQR